MTYPEPKTFFSGPFRLLDTNSETPCILSSEEVRLQLSYLHNIGWEIELRYDEHISGFHRQPFTGAQETLSKSKLQIDEGDSAISFNAEASSLCFERSNGRFSLLSQGEQIFSTASVPFTLHRTPVHLYEGLMSLKVTDFAERAPFSPKGQTFLSNMVRFQFSRPEGAVFGLPGQCGEANRNGYRFELYNTDEFLHIPSRRPMYQSWPILIFPVRHGARWIGVFHDNPSRTFVDLGDFYPELCTFESLTGNSRVYLVEGWDLKEVSQKISRLLGSAALPPLWAFGYQQCRWSYMSSSEIHEVADRLHNSDIPCDALYFDIDYMDKFKVFTFDQNRFAELPQCIERLNEKGFEAVSIIDPGVKAQENYPTYETLIRSGEVLKSADGSPFLIKCWPGESVLPDFFKESARHLWADMQSSWIKETGFSGIWNDMNEPSNFAGGNAATAQALSQAGTMAELYNLYGYFMAKASNEGWKDARPEKRGVVITRSGYPGVQQYAVIWHGDNQAWWEHMRLAIDTTLAYSMCGAYYSGPDVPGFTGNPSDDLAIRFFQLGSFLPLFRGHSIFFAKDKEPYAYSAEASGIIRDAVKLRYSLLREWYSGFEYAIRNLLSPITPVFKDITLIRDQFLLFNKLLVAPIIERDQIRRSVYFPPGRWYPLGDSSTWLEGDRWHDFEVSLKSVPVFVRSGNILVRNSPGKNTTETLAAEESFEIYPDENQVAMGYWYNDDGISVIPDHISRKLLVLEDGTVVKKNVGSDFSFEQM